MNRDQPFLLVFDVGTTSVRACLCNEDGRLFAMHGIPLPQHYPQPGWVEQDPLDLWQLSRQAAEEVLQQAGAHWGAVAAIGLTNQRETIVFWDKETGIPIYNAIVWQCRRTRERCETLKAQGLADMIRSKTGLIIDPYFSASKMQWLFRHIPEAETLCKQGRLLAGTVDTWMIWQLSGKTLHVTDFSNASRTMLLNIHTKAWDTDLLALFDISLEILPKVLLPNTPIGKTAPEITGGVAVPIAAAVGDQQAALFGQQCWEPGTAKATYGTGTFLMANLGDRAVDSKGGLLTTLAYNQQLKPVYALEGAVFTAGAALEWLQNQLGCFQDGAEAGRMAEDLEDNGGVYLVPAFTGLGAPYWNSEARGLLTGLTLGTGKAHLARAAFEAMAYQTRDILTLMQAEGGFVISALKIDGGVSRSRFFAQFLADILDLPVLRTDESEATALGAAYLAGLSSGFWQTVPESAGKSEKFLPRMEALQREKLCREWQQAVQRSLLQMSCQ